MLKGEIEGKEGDSERVVKRGEEGRKGKDCSERVVKRDRREGRDQDCIGISGRVYVREGGGRLVGNKCRGRGGRGRGQTERRLED